MSVILRKEGWCTNMGAFAAILFVFCKRWWIRVFALGVIIFTPFMMHPSVMVDHLLAGIIAIPICYVVKWIIAWFRKK